MGLEVREGKGALLLQGVIVYFRVMDGEMRVGDMVKLINTGKELQIGELGVLAPKPVQVALPCHPQRDFCREFEGVSG